MKEIRNSATEVIPIAGAGQSVGIGPYCQQGNTYDTREGNKITMKSIAMNIRVALNAIEPTGTSVRILLVYDRKPNGALAAADDVLTGDNLLDFINRDGNMRGRFQIWFDRTIPFDAVQTNWTDSFYKKLNTPVIYDGNAGTVADIYKGNVFLVSLAAENASTIDVHYGYRILFTDD